MDSQTTQDAESSRSALHTRQDRTLVRAFHGTSEKAAATVLADGFRPSARFDWLGDGIYFYQDNSWRAQQHAEKLFRRNSVVLESEIELAGCMDLLNPDWFVLLTEAHERMLINFNAAGVRLPWPTWGAWRTMTTYDRRSGTVRGMGRAVINLAAKIAADAGSPIRSVRAIFHDGRPALPGCSLHDQSNVQIAVRDRAAILMTQVSESRNNG